MSVILFEEELEGFISVAKATCKEGEMPMYSLPSPLFITEDQLRQMMKIVQHPVDLL